MKLQKGNKPPKNNKKRFGMAALRQFYVTKHDLPNNKLIAIRRAMLLPRRELKIMSILWSNAMPMTLDDITKAVYPVHHSDKRTNRISRRIKSLIKKKAVVINPDGIEGEEETYLPVYTREAHVHYSIEWFHGNYRPRYSYKDRVSAIGNFIKKIIKKRD